MATITVTTPVSDNVLSDAADFNAITSSAAVSNIVNADLAASMKDGAAGVETARSLGTGALQATAGNDARLTDDRTASGIRFGTNSPVPFDSALPTTGQFLRFNGASIIGADPSATANITGTGTVSTATASQTVTGVGTKFLTELAVGFLITVNSVTWRVTAIASDTSLTVNANWGANNSGQAYTYIISVAKRAWNTISTKSTTFTAADTDSGVLFACDGSGGAYVATLPAANKFSPGDTIAFAKTTDDVNTISITCAGSDVFDDNTTVRAITMVGSSITICSNGVGVWRVVAKNRMKGEIIQQTRNTDSTAQDLTTVIPTNAAPTWTDGTAISPLKVTLTPVSAFSKIRVRGYIPAGTTNGRYLAAAIFSTVSAVHVFRNVSAQRIAGASYHLVLEFNFVFTSGSTGSAMDIDVRLGPDNGTLFYLRDQSGTALYGGLQASLEVTEECL